MIIAPPTVKKGDQLTVTGTMIGRKITGAIEDTNLTGEEAKYVGRWGYVWVTTAALLPLALAAAAILARKRPSGSWRESLLEVGMVYLSIPWVWMILTPVTVPPGTEMVHLVPGEDIVGLWGSGQFWVQIGGNLGVFLALGALAPMRTAKLHSLWRLFVLGAAGSLGLELVQHLLVGGRVFSVDDVLLNALGCLLGGLLTKRWWRPGRSSGPDLPPLREGRLRE